MIKIRYKKYIYNWLENKKPYIKESSYANYSNIITNYIVPKLGKYSIKKINHELIQKHIFYLNKELKLSVKTIKDVVIVIKSSLKKYNSQLFLMRFEYPKCSFIKNTNILTKNDQNKIVKYIINNNDNKNIGILLSLILGLRIGELCALRWDNINFDKKTISINKTLQRIYIKGNNKSISKVIVTSPKSLNSNREIPLNEEVTLLLYKLKLEGKFYILTGTEKFIEPRSYRNYFNKLLANLDIEHHKFHSLRHTFATNCLELGFDYKMVSELLGHSNISTTLNIYVHPKMSQKRKCINELYSSYR